MSETTTTNKDPTPYEEFLEFNLDQEKLKLEQVRQRYSTANFFSKMFLKRELDSLLQNVTLLEKDLITYRNTGIDWLREHTKERDEKAERLKPVPAEVFGVKPEPSRPPPAQAKAPVGTSPATTTSRPTTGRPMIGKPVTQGSQPTSGPTQNASPTPSQPTATKEEPASTPSVSPPRVIGRPRIGTPIGQPAKKDPSNEAQGETDKGTSSS